MKEKIANAEKRKIKWQRTNCCSLRQKSQNKASRLRTCARTRFEQPPNLLKNDLILIGYFFFSKKTHPLPARTRNTSRRSRSPPLPALRASNSCPRAASGRRTRRRCSWWPASSTSSFWWHRCSKRPKLCYQLHRCWRRTWQCSPACTTTERLRPLGSPLRERG